MAARPLAPLAVSMGDPAGIGPDITLMAWMARQARQIPPFALYGDSTVLRARAKALNILVPIQEIESLATAAETFAHALPVIGGALAGPIAPGQPSAASASATIAAIDQATAAAMSGSARALVTNPIAKHVLYAAGFRHPGHTEYLAHLAQASHPGETIVPVMMLASRSVEPGLRVVPATIHIPLADVPNALTAASLATTIRITHVALRSDFGIATPRIAVAGLNPHAGERGTIGTEETTLIAPVIAALKSEGLNVTGPHSADTLFHAAARTGYDAVVAMYHDQALIPIKTLAFDSGVNITLGLPFVRTSPDHGTAFDIAGTGKASPESLIQALLLADEMATLRARRLFALGQGEYP
jgi:4-hydroxythreonine-4-phosphate dehydrogenase